VLLKSRCIGFEPTLVLQPAFDKIEGDLWQPPLRHAVQVFDIYGLVDPHIRVISSTRGKMRVDNIA
jgi:hypothetical protein